MDDRDDLDDLGMERLLGGASGPFPDVNAALVTVRGRVRRAKRRRAVASGAVACAMLFGAATWTAGRVASPSPRLQSPAGSLVADEPSTSAASTVDETGSSTATTPATTAPTAPTTTSPTTPTSATAPVAGAPTNPTPGASAPPTSAPASAASTTTADASTGADQVRTFAGVGGSITIRLRGDSLALVSTTPATGFGIESGALVSGSRIEVRFLGVDHATRIRVDLVDGAMDERIEESGSGKG